MTSSAISIYRSYCCCAVGVVSCSSCSKRTSQATSPCSHWVRLCWYHTGWQIVDPLCVVVTGWFSSWSPGWPAVIVGSGSSCCPSNGSAGAIGFACSSIVSIISIALVCLVGWAHCVLPQTPAECFVWFCQCFLPIFVMY